MLDYPTHPFSRLSMVNTLVQAENASSHGFMSALMREGKALVHAMWFDVRSGDLLYFSRREKVGNNYGRVVSTPSIFESNCLPLPELELI